LLLRMSRSQSSRWLSVSFTPVLNALADTHALRWTQNGAVCRTVTTGIGNRFLEWRVATTQFPDRLKASIRGDVMAKGIVQSATDAVKTVAGAAVGAAAAAAATVVVESVANSIRAKSKGREPPPAAAPAVEEAVRTLLTPPAKPTVSAQKKTPTPSATSLKAASRKKAANQKRAASKKKISARKTSKPIAKKKRVVKAKKARKRR
jgi:hypothetical protein